MSKNVGSRQRKQVGIDDAAHTGASRKLPTWNGKRAVVNLLDLVEFLDANRLRVIRTRIIDSPFEIVAEVNGISESPASMVANNALAKANG